MVTALKETGGRTMGRGVYMIITKNYSNSSSKKWFLNLKHGSELLKEIDISVTELGRFTSLNRIDEILDFLSEKVRARLFKKDANQSNTDRLRVKEQELLGDYEIQIEALKRKQQEREGI